MGVLREWRVSKWTNFSQGKKKENKMSLLDCEVLHLVFCLAKMVVNETRGGRKGETIHKKNAIEP